MMKEFMLDNAKQNTIYLLLFRLLTITNPAFRMSVAFKDFRYARRALVAFALYHLGDCEIVHGMDKTSGDELLKSSQNFVRSLTNILDQFSARHSVCAVDEDLLDSFGDIALVFFQWLKKWITNLEEAAKARIFHSLHSIICHQELSKTDQTGTIQNLRDEFVEVMGDQLEFDVKIKEFKCSINIIKRLEVLYDTPPSQRNPETIESLRNLFKQLNGPNSLDPFDASNKRREAQRRQSDPSRKRRTLAPSDMPDPLIILQHKVENIHNLIHLIKSRKEQSLPAIIDSPMISGGGRKWAALHKDVLQATTSTSTMLTQNCIAQAIFKRGIFDHKINELAFNVSGGETTFNLSNAYHHFLNCSIVSRIEHGLFSAVLVNSPYFSPFLIFTQGEASCGVHIHSADNAIHITAQPSKAEHFRLNLVLVEIKFCALCGKPAKKKCATCWNNCSACVRYCSNQCFRADYSRHRTVCCKDPVPAC